MTRERIGIFGGSFDPIHFGHLRSAEEIGERFGLGKVIFVPSFVHPLKTADLAASASHRLEMARLACEGNPLFEVNDYELTRAEVSYSVFTLEHFNEVYPQSELFFALGMDGWLEITSWYRYKSLFEIANIVVHSRPGYGFKPPKEILPAGEAAKFESEGEKYVHSSGKSLSFIEVSDLKISATDIRNRRRVGKSIRYLTPERVVEYIAQHKLYAEGKKV